MRYNGTGGNLDVAEIEFYGFASDLITSIRDNNNVKVNTNLGTGTKTGYVKFYDLSGRCSSDQPRWAHTGRAAKTMAHCVMCIAHKNGDNINRYSRRYCLHYR